MEKNIYEKSRKQSNGVDDKTELIETSTVKECKFNKEEDDGVGNTRKEENNVTIQRKIKKFGVAIETIYVSIVLYIFCCYINYY